MIHILATAIIAASLTAGSFLALSKKPPICPTVPGHQTITTISDRDSQRCIYQPEATGFAKKKIVFNQEMKK